MIVVVINEPGNHSFTFVIEDDFGCVYDTTHTVFVKEPIVLNIPERTCNDTLIMSSNQGFSDGLWSAYNSPGTPTFITPQNINPTVIFPSPGIYNLVYNDQTCPDGDTAVIEYIAYPYTQLNSDTMCIGESYTIVALQSEQNGTYEWSTGQTGPSIVITTGGEYTVSATNFCGTNTATAFITEILCDFEVPNVFSPNGDGANDNFTLVFSEGMVKFNIVIVNRWGNVVREFDVADFEWDGTDAAGNQMAEGVYFYKAIGTLFGGNELEKQGFIQLIRE
jgi:gliding motility-associated-like protein